MLTTGKRALTDGAQLRWCSKRCEPRLAERVSADGPELTLFPEANLAELRAISEDVILDLPHAVRDVDGRERGSLEAALV